jgi:hypothetical protein
MPRDLWDGPGQDIGHQEEWEELARNRKEKKKIGDFVFKKDKKKLTVMTFKARFWRGI